MPFGKRGQIEVEDAPDIAASLPVLPPNPTAIEWLTCFWKLCKALPFGLGQGVISYGYHLLSSMVLTIAILLLSPDLLSRFAEAMKPHWPLLARAEPYMNAHGHHQLFLYMSAMYFKDLVLVSLFSIRNTIWCIISYAMIHSKVKIRFRSKTFLLGFLAPAALVFSVDQLYYGPYQIPSDVLHRSVFDGNIYRGIILPELLVYPMVVLVSFYSPWLMCLPVVEGQNGYLLKLKQMRDQP